MSTALVHGLGIAGRATALALSRRGWTVSVGDDTPHHDHRDFAATLGTSVLTTAEALDLVTGVDLLVPAPGVPPTHPVVVAAVAAGVDVRSEIDIASEWEQSREGGPRPVLAITGTDGKTTTTMLTAAILRTAGLSVAEVGNTDRPFIDALDDAVDAFVVECSSFRLEFTSVFRADGAACLNIAPDHLDWHGSFAAYRDAKAKLWRHAEVGDVAVVPADDAVVGSTIEGFAGRVVTFGIEAGDYRVVDGSLRCPHGVIGEVASMRRAMPHDVTNALAAAALVLETGLAGTAAVAETLRHFEPAAHRIQFVGTHLGRDWYDDSKATSPHAALTAIRAFDRLVLIAGGRNKNLALEELATGSPRVAAVVAIGESASVLASVFEGLCPVRVATSMGEAVSLAADLAADLEPAGVPVVLSPGCTSYDWYGNYGERGDDFQRCVRDLSATRTVDA